ncbi:MAG: cation:dicarboxylate symporter family transporter, partial [Caldimonas sp.]
TAQQKGQQMLQKMNEQSLGIGAEGSATGGAGSATGGAALRMQSEPDTLPTDGAASAAKGAAGITGSGFIVLAATLSAVGHVPVAGLALILGIDRFMSEARALTNLVGNGVATLVVAKWTGDLDVERLRRQLDGETDAEADEPEEVLDAATARLPA